MITSLFENLLPYLSVVSTVAIVLMAIQGTRRKDFGIAGSQFGQSRDPAGYWVWFALFWTCALIGVIITLAMFGLDVRFWL